MPAPCSKCGAFVIPTSEDFEADLTIAPRTLARFSELLVTNNPPGNPAHRPKNERAFGQSRRRDLPAQRASAGAGGITQRAVDISCSDRQDYCPRQANSARDSGRNIFLGASSFISIDFSVEEQYPLELIKLQMNRARSLKIHFFGSEDSNQIAPFKLLAEHSDPWEELWCSSSGALWSQMEDSVDFFQTAIDFTRYDLDAPWETHRELLKSLSKLEEVLIRRDYDLDGNWPAPGEPISVSRGTTVEIGIVACGADCTARLGTFILRSACSPHALRIEAVLPPSIAEILRKYPAFIDIAVIPPDNDHVARVMFSAFISLFTVSQTTPPTLAFPHVTDIGFAFYNADPLARAQIHGRWRGCKHLGRLGWRFRCGLNVMHSSVSIGGPANLNGHEISSYFPISILLSELAARNIALYL
ncbi:hypothetical protein C8R45DRAFT_941683 [Mycena sanguinolenta]|nr:hypothetical protein C8R45DRAFT_941683 [Mycena sanguinolenta]